jgi:hypothetical protein
MTMLIIEQGAAIQSQSNLIKVLLPDSRELWSLKGKAISDKERAKTQAQNHTQAPSREPMTQSPSASAAPQAHAQNRAADKATKPKEQFPPIPASELDPRRAVRTI